MNETDRTEIEALINTYGEYLKAENVEGILGLYTEDAVFVPGNGMVSAGTAQLRQAYEGLFQAIGLDAQFTFKDVLVSGALAFVRTESRGTTLLKQENKTIPEGNIEFFVLQKPAGAWKIARYMFVEKAK